MSLIFRRDREISTKVDRQRQCLGGPKLTWLSKSLCSIAHQFTLFGTLLRFGLSEQRVLRKPTKKDPKSEKCLRRLSKLGWLPLESMLHAGADKYFLAVQSEQRRALCPQSGASFAK